MNTKKITRKINHPQTFGKVAVIYGGFSAEKEVSLRSGKAVYDALKKNEINAILIDPSQCDLVQTLKLEQIERVFLMLHGKIGEDGVIQGVLEYLNIPYTGSGVMASSIGMDKLKTKQIWQAYNLPVLPSFEIQHKNDFDKAISIIGFPMAIKPTKEGSSIGVSKVCQPEDLEKAWLNAGGQTSSVFAEPWITGKGEYTVAILKDQALPSIKVSTDLEFYNFEAKYNSQSTQYFCPSGLSEQDEFLFQSIALKAFKAVEARTWGRIDFVVDDQNNPWLLEINTIPGMTDHSLVPMAAKQAGISFEELCWFILEETVD